MLNENVVIGIPTFKRPLQLERLLTSLAKQEIDLRFTIIVADNEGLSGAGLLRASEMSSSYPYDIICLPVEARGISNVRNAIMTKAFAELDADLLAMVDDDEVVDKHWLKELLLAHQKSGAEIIGGAIIPEFESPPPEWTKLCPLYFRKIREEGEVQLIQAAGNILLSKNAFIKSGSLLFSEEFGLTGGEDKEFFLRLKDLGCRFYFAPKAVSYEFYGNERVSINWAIERSYRIGSNDVRIILSRNCNVLLRLNFFIQSLVSLLFFSASYLVALTRRKNEFLVRLKVHRQLGKLSAFLGKSENFYK
ncbi:glycosyltransferase family 2 protein [Bowmanella yangjiangensis]|uniref:Glycosyltransferase family 2 protein n=1 Tax=Bowmanella yangjiangensis TaxID=2811230 RepID=A0ABS3CSX1_9ALTE|nr:glycosyltransferase family 2 protein [Bowmanella yangjiangensis]